MNKIRKIPPVCLITALAGLLTGRLRLSGKYVDSTAGNEEGQSFRIFRNIGIYKSRKSSVSCVFVVRFKFAHLSHEANKLASIIPMLMIAGFPGFVQKLYAVNKENGHWQGMYEWKSMEHLDAYKQSFVYRMMIKRSLKGTVQSHTVPDCHLSDLMEPDKYMKRYAS